MRITLDDYVGKCMYRNTYKGPRLGLELEYEGCSSGSKTLNQHWHTEIDHSLRTGGLEYISTPLKPLELHDAIHTMVGAAKARGATVTKRCGMHVHVNCTHLTWRELFQFVTYYTLLEPTLFKEYCPEREISHFCVPTWTNTVLTEYMYSDHQRLRSGIPIEDAGYDNDYATAVNLLSSKTPRYGLDMLRTPKYAALNVASLKKFGTLEFRQAPSTLDPVFMYTWAMLLQKIQTVSRGYADATDIIKEYEREGLFTLCDKVGLRHVQVISDADQEDAADAATIVAGHKPVNWKQLEWEIS